MGKPTKKKTGAPKRVKSERKDLTVDELCALWQRVLDYRRDLQDRVRIAKGGFPLPTGGMVDPETASRVAILRKTLDDPEFARRSKYVDSAITDLLAFDRQLSKHTARQNPPIWLNSDWVQGCRCENLCAFDSLQRKDYKGRLPGTLKIKVREAFRFVDGLVWARDNKDKSGYEAFFGVENDLLVDAASHLFLHGRGNPDPLFLKQNRELYSSGNSQSRNDKRFSRVTELINSSKDGVNETGKHSSVRNRAAWVLSQVFGVHMQTILNRWVKR